MKGSYKGVFLAAIFLLTSCNAGSNLKNAVPQNLLLDADIASYFKKIPTTYLNGRYVREGLQAIADNDYEQAQTGFSRALKFDPANANLHFLNGLSYHLLAANGDASQLPYAGMGYKLALQYDSTFFWAAYQLGHIRFSQQNYMEAQEAFAYALLLEPNNLELLNALAAASYYAQDIATATEVTRRAIAIKPDNPVALRNAVMIYSAGENFSDAVIALSHYKKELGGIESVGPERLSKRIKSWRDFHARNVNLHLADAADILGSDNSAVGFSDDTESTGSTGNTESYDNTESNTEDISDSNKIKTVQPRMALVDVVIIRSEERMSTSKGLNLLSGLTATLGGSTIDYNNSITSTTGSSPSAPARTETLTFNPTLSVAATYSLNIFNDNNDQNEVIARPSLVAVDGKKSEFFTGAVLHVELDGISGSEGTVEDVPIGVTLSVTPNFISDDIVQLEVGAERAFIESRSSQIGFNNFAQTTKTTINANVTMKFGETLILSGLSEKENENLRDGVPFLQDIPIIQYLFSDRDTAKYQKSVLILITPRKPRYTYRDGTPKVSEPDEDMPQPHLNELNDRFSQFKPASNLDIIFNHLKDRRYFREFHTGDVKLETWRSTSGIKQRIKRAIEFLYY